MLGRPTCEFLRVAVVKYPAVTQYLSSQAALLRLQVCNPRHDGVSLRGAEAELPGQPAPPDARLPLHSGDGDGEEVEDPVPRDAGDGGCAFSSQQDRDQHEEESGHCVHP